MTAEAFKIWRSKMGWTQQEAATHLGMHRKSLSNYECGLKPIPVVVRLATERLALAAA